MWGNKKEGGFGDAGKRGRLENGPHGDLCPLAFRYPLKMEENFLEIFPTVECVSVLRVLSSLGAPSSAPS